MDILPVIIATTVFQWWFCTSFIPSTYINCNSSVRKNYLFSLVHLFIQSFIYISLDTWVFILSNGLWFNNIVAHFVAQSVPSLAIGNFFRFVPIFFWQVSYFLNNFLVFLVHKMLQVHPIFFVSQLWNQPLLQEILACFVG